MDIYLAKEGMNSYSNFIETLASVWSTNVV